MKKFILPVLCAVLFAGCGGNDESVLLRVKYKQGEEHDITIITDATSKDAFKTAFHSETTVKFRVDSVLGNSYNCSYFVKSMKYTQSQDGKVADSYDSEKSPRAMAEAELEMHESLSKTFESIFLAETGSRGNLLTPLRYSSGDSVQPGDYPFDLPSFQITFPEKAVKVGDTWTNEMTVPSALGKRKRTFAFKVHKITAEEVYLDVNPSVEGLSDENSSSGVYIIDRATGRLRGASWKIDMKISVISNEIKVK